MKKLILLTVVMLTVIANATACSNDDSSEANPEVEVPAGESNILVVYFSQSGNTQRVAQRIAEVMEADIYRITASEPYRGDGYPDSDRVQDEAYNDRRPGVANLPENLDDYDTIFVGSPIWWHQPAMVVCTFLENYDLNGKTVIPFFTYGARSYLNESMQKIYKLTPNSTHIPATLPEDLDPENIREPQNDDEGIDMPGNANGVEAWLRRIGLLTPQ